MQDLFRRAELLEKIQEMTRQIDDLKTQIHRLKLSDPDYAAYAARCDARGLYPQMDLGIFWMTLGTIKRIEALEPTEPEEAVKYWKKNRQEYARATRALLLR